VQSPGTITTIEVLAQSPPDASNTPSGAPAVHQLITLWGQRADVAKVTVQPSKPRKVNAAFVRRWRTSDQLIKRVVRVNPVVATHQGRGCTFEAKLLACCIPTDPQQSAIPYSLYPGQGISRQLGTSALCRVFQVALGLVAAFLAVALLALRAASAISIATVTADGQAPSISTKAS